MTNFSRRVLAALTASALCVGIAGAVTAVAADDSAVSTTGSSTVVAGADTLDQQQVTLEKGTANLDWVHSFREYVGLSGETRADGLEVDEYNGYLLWPMKANQEVDLNDLKQLELQGSVHWQKYEGELDLELANPTIDFVNKKLMIDGKSVGTLKNPGVAVDRRDALLDLPDLKAEIIDGYLRVTSFEPVVTSFSDELVGFYEGETRQPLVLTAKIKDAEEDNPVPILWKLFPKRYGSLRPSGVYEDDPSLLDEPVEFEPRLDECIRWELDIEDPETPITTKQLQKLNRLFCIGEGNKGNGFVTDISGLAYAPRLAQLYIQDQKITDVSPLEQLKNLVYLDVSNNPLGSLSGLGYQPKLQTLRANNTDLTSIRPLIYLEQLTRLELNDNSLTSLEGLPNNKEDLAEISAKNNKIRDAEVLKDFLYLKDINLQNNQIADVSPLAIRGLENLDVRDNYIADFSPLEPIAEKKSSFSIINLEEIKIENNLVEDVSNLSDNLRQYLVGPDNDGHVKAREDKQRPDLVIEPAISPVTGELTVEEGEEYSLSVTATGTPAPTFTWEKNVDGVWAPIESATEATFVKTAELKDNGMEIRAVATNAGGSKATKPVVLNVTAKPVEPTPSATVEPTPSATVEPTSSTSVEPTPSVPVEPTPSTSVEPSSSVTVEPTTSTPSVSEAPTTSAPAEEEGGTSKSSSGEPKKADELRPEAIVGIVLGVVALLGLVGHIFLNFEQLRAQLMELLP